MPRGIANPKPAPAPASPEDPAPMIFIEPAFDGSIRINAYGLGTGSIIDALRRVLIHLEAQQSGVQIIALDVPARAAATGRRGAVPELAAKPGRNGSRPSTRPVYSHADLDADSED